MEACAINVMNIISSFAWISQFTALAVSDCPPDGSQQAGASGAELDVSCGQILIRGFYMYTYAFMYVNIYIHIFLCVYICTYSS